MELRCPGLPLLTQEKVERLRFYRESRGERQEGSGLLLKALAVPSGPCYSLKVLAFCQLVVL